MITKDFIEKAIKLNGGSYDYSLVEYKNTNTKVKIICNKCKNIFLQTPHSHLNGRGCPYCFGTPKKTTEQFIEEIKHFNLDTSKVNYVTNSQKVLLGCKKHKGDPKSDSNGIYWFWITPNALLKKSIPCERCSKRPNIDTEDFIEKAKKLNGDDYDYSLVNYKNVRTKVKIICNKCGNIFLQLPSKHLNNQGCPNCKESKGEKKIRNYLIENKIDYFPQKTFPDLKDVNLLSYDFYLPKYNLLIEFNGEQHYKWIKQFQLTLHDFHRQLHHDWLKRKYAKKNGINLLTIKYNYNIIRELSNYLGGKNGV